MKKIRLLIVDDHAVLRAGLRMLLNAQPDMEVIGEADNAAEAAQKVTDLHPDVVLLDITLPDKNGTRVATTLRKRSPRTRLLVLTMHEDEGYLSEALRAGCDGYVVKRAADAELIAAIRAVHRGGVFVSPSLARVMVERYLETTTECVSPTNAPNRLTSRETEVLSLIARGHTNKEIADLLFVSVKTVESHKANIMEKLSLSSRAQLVRYAMEQGLLPPPR